MKAKAAGFSLVNIALDRGRERDVLGPWARGYADKARALGMGVCAYRWVDNRLPGAESARIAYARMRELGGPDGMAHQVDCEDNATWAIWQDYVNEMQQLLGRHVCSYSGRWWWAAAERNWPGSTLTPYHWAAPNSGYLDAYPGDDSPHWHAGYGGWTDLSVMQYAVKPLPGTGDCSLSAIRSPAVWAALTGGAVRIPGVPYVQGRNSYKDVDGTKFGIAIHNTSNDASDEGEASYATRRTDGISAHLYCDRDSVTQSLDLLARAGHAGSTTGNENAVAVEVTGANGWSRQQWIDNVAWDKLAAALAFVCRQFNVAPRRASVAEMKANPKVRAFYGHDDMRLAWAGTTHTDPGPNFPWDVLLARVQQALDGGVDVAFFDDPHAKKLAYRVDAETYMSDKLRDGSDEPHLMVQAVKRIDATVAELKAKVDQLAEPAPVDMDQLAEALRKVVRQEVAARFADAGDVDGPAG